MYGNNGVKNYMQLFAMGKPPIRHVLNYVSFPSYVVCAGRHDAQNCRTLQLCPNEDGFCLWWPRQFRRHEDIFFIVIVLCVDTVTGGLCPFE
jgi:hypothetical protein